MTNNKSNKQVTPQTRIEVDRSEFRGFARSIGQVSFLLILLATAYIYFGDMVIASRDTYIAFIIAFAFALFMLRSLPGLYGRIRVQITLEALAMTVFVTAIAMLTGGDDSALRNLYLLPLIVSAVVLGKRDTVWMLLFVFLCYTALSFWNSSSGSLTAVRFIGLTFEFAPITLVTFLATLLSENIRQTRTHIESIAERDDLTDLYNMRAFSRRLDAVHLAAVTHDQKYAIVMIDVDNLKPINDEYGHDAGNRAIKLVGQAVMRCIRSSDVAARYGGDEFIVLLPSSDTNSSDQAVKRIRNSVYATTLKVGPKMVRISVSIGLATFPVDGKHPGDLLARADKAMYQDKALRRDQRQVPGLVENT